MTARATSGGGRDLGPPPYSPLCRVVARHQLFQRHDAVTRHSGPPRQLPEGRVGAQIRPQRKNTVPCDQKRPRSSGGGGTSLPKKKAKEKQKRRRLQNPHEN